MSGTDADARNGAVGRGSDPDGHRPTAVALFNRTWELLGKTDRTADETDELIGAAHASRYHWSKAGTLINLARGDWQISRVYAALKRGEPARWHAARCLDLVEAATAVGLAEDWDRAAAYEAMARAALAAGDREAAGEWRDRGMEALDAIDDADDREQIERDLAGLSI